MLTGARVTPKEMHTFHCHFGGASGNIAPLALLTLRETAVSGRVSPLESQKTWESHMHFSVFCLVSLNN